MVQHVAVQMLCKIQMIYVTVIALTSSADRILIAFIQIFFIRKGSLSFLQESRHGRYTPVSRWIASHFQDDIAERFLNGQTELGAAKNGRWMSRTVCRRPARWASFFFTWPGRWPTLVSPGSLSFSVFLPGASPLPPSSSARIPLHILTASFGDFCPSPRARSPLPPRSGFRWTRVASTINDLHHRPNRPPPPILVEGAAYDLAMRLQQHMPWHEVQRSDRYHPVC